MKKMPRVLMAMEICMMMNMMTMSRKYLLPTTILSDCRMGILSSSGSCSLPSLSSVSESSLTENTASVLVARPTMA